MYKDLLYLMLPIWWQQQHQANQSQWLRLDSLYYQWNCHLLSLCRFCEKENDYQVICVRSM